MSEWMKFNTKQIVKRARFDWEMLFLFFLYNYFNMNVQHVHTWIMLWWWMNGEDTQSWNAQHPSTFVCVSPRFWVRMFWLGHGSSSVWYSKHFSLLVWQSFWRLIMVKPRFLQINSRIIRPNWFNCHWKLFNFIFNETFNSPCCNYTNLIGQILDCFLCR